MLKSETKKLVINTLQSKTNTLVNNMLQSETNKPVINALQSKDTRLVINARTISITALTQTRGNKRATQSKTSHRALHVLQDYYNILKDQLRMSTTSTRRTNYKKA